MITDTISAKIMEAMKAHDEIRLSTLKLLLSALNYEKIDKQHHLTEEEELAVVRREAKKRKDSIEIYQKAGATDRADKEKKELAILEEYLPAQMTDGDLEKLVEEAMRETGATSLADTGKVIGFVMSKSGGNADGAKVAQMVKTKLN